MNGPPQSVLALAYAAVAGLGLLFIQSQDKDKEPQEDLSAAFPSAEAPSPLATLLKAPSSELVATGIAASDKWRADAAKEYDKRQLAEQKRKLEADWFAAYNEKLRSNVALKSQVLRSASSQVARNRGVSAKASTEAQDQDVAPTAKKRGVWAMLRSAFGKKQR